MLVPEMASPNKSESSAVQLANFIEFTLRSSGISKDPANTASANAHAGPINPALLSLSGLTPESVKSPGAASK